MYPAGLRATRSAISIHRLPRSAITRQSLASPTRPAQAGQPVRPLDIPSCRPDTGAPARRPHQVAPHRRRRELHVPSAPRTQMSLPTRRSSLRQSSSRHSASRTFTNADSRSSACTAKRSLCSRSSTSRSKSLAASTLLISASVSSFGSRSCSVRKARSRRSLPPAIVRYVADAKLLSARPTWVSCVFDTLPPASGVM